MNRGVGNTIAELVEDMRLVKDALEQLLDGSGTKVRETAFAGTPIHDHSGGSQGGPLRKALVSDYLQFLEQGSSPGVPPSGASRLFADGDGDMTQKDDAGSEADLSAGGGSSLTVQEEDGAPIDTAVTVIRVPNGGLVDNGAGDVSLGYALSAHAHAHDHTTADGTGPATNDEHDGFSEYAEIATPSAPAANKIRVYAKDLSGRAWLHFVTDGAGTEHIVASNAHTHAGTFGESSTVSPATLDLPASASPAQTADGRIVWDSDDNLLTVGDGSSRQTFYPLARSYSPHSYVFVADVAIDTNVTTGDNQGGVFHHSYDNAETVKRIITEFEVAPTGSAATIQLEYGDTDDLDTVASWTEIDSVSHTAAAKTIITTASFTNSSIPANRLIRMNVDAVGSTEPGENLTVHLQTLRQLVAS